MKIFVFEFITGGGLACEPLPPSLAEEGERMLRALVADLLPIPGVEVLVARDRRLPQLPGIETIAVGPESSPSAAYLRGLAEADAVWPIAPESDGILGRLTHLAEDQGKVLLGSRPGAVVVAQSKLRTAAALAAAGVPVAPVYADPLMLPDLPGAWVIKPDDGAGCVDTLWLADRGQACAALRCRSGGNLVAGPWIEGDAQSLSLICRDGDAEVLSRNRQHIRVVHGRVGLHGLSVAALPVTTAHERLARAVAQAIPGLWGYVGIDLVDTADGPQVIEINPRLTTSYCGLASALGINPAARVLALLDHSASTDLPIRRILPFARPVEIGLEGCHA